MPNDPDSTERADAWAKTLTGQLEALHAWRMDFRDAYLKALHIPQLVERLGRFLDRHPWLNRSRNS